MLLSFFHGIWLFEKILDLKKLNVSFGSYEFVFCLIFYCIMLETLTQSFYQCFRKKPARLRIPPKDRSKLCKISWTKRIHTSTTSVSPRLCSLPPRLKQRRKKEPAALTMWTRWTTRSATEASTAPNANMSPAGASTERCATTTSSRSRPSSLPHSLSDGGSLTTIWRLEMPEGLELIALSKIEAIFECWECIAEKDSSLEVKKLDRF